MSFHNFNNTLDDHRTYGLNGGSGTAHMIFLSESSVRHTASGLAWKLSVATETYITANFPAVFPIAKVYCQANTLKTISVWLRRTNTGLTGKLLVRGAQLAGMTLADYVAPITVAADIWEQVTVSFTPTEAGVVDVEVLLYGGTTYSLYVDHLTA